MGVSESERQKRKDWVLEGTSKCRACRFCVDVCPTYQAVDGIESMCAFGRLQILRYLLCGTLNLDDSLSYCLYTCLQCKSCEVVCKSKGQNLEICDLIRIGRSLVTDRLVQGTDNDRI